MACLKESKVAGSHPFHERGPQDKVGERHRERIAVKCLEKLLEGFKTRWCLARSDLHFCKSFWLLCREGLREMQGRENHEEPEDCRIY